MFGVLLITVSDNNYTSFNEFLFLSCQESGVGILESL